MRSASKGCEVSLQLYLIRATRLAPKPTSRPTSPAATLSGFQTLWSVVLSPRITFNASPNRGTMRSGTRLVTSKRKTSSEESQQRASGKLKKGRPPNSHSETRVDKEPTIRLYAKDGFDNWTRSSVTRNPHQGYNLGDNDVT